MELKKMKIILIVLIISVGVSYAQSSDTSFVVFNGKVIDADTKEPVTANVSFESMPYGSDIGNIISNAADGTFNFYMRKDQKYSLRVKAEGFFAFVEIYDVNESSNNGMIAREIELAPGGVGHLITLEHLIFEQGKADITEESFDELDKLVIMLQETPTMEIQLEGHTDFRGPATANMNLSQMRVDATKSYLVSKGSDSNRITTKAFGGTQPITRENTTEARAKNRRVVVRITKL